MPGIREMAPPCKPNQDRGTDPAGNRATGRTRTLRTREGRNTNSKPKQTGRPNLGIADPISGNPTGRPDPHHRSRPDHAAGTNPRREKHGPLRRQLLARLPTRQQPDILPPPRRDYHRYNRTHQAIRPLARHSNPRPPQPSTGTNHRRGRPYTCGRISNPLAETVRGPKKFSPRISGDKPEMFRPRNWHYSQAPYRRGQPNRACQASCSEHAAQATDTQHPVPHCRQSTQSNAKGNAETTTD